MDETEQKINNEVEYRNLGVNPLKKTDKNSPSNRKISVGILKGRTNRANTFKQKERTFNSSNCIKWDNKSINEQKDYRKKHPMDKEKLKESKSKFANSAIYSDDDVYMKGLNKVNQLNDGDEIIFKVLMSLGYNNKSMKKIKSCLTLGKYHWKIEMREFYEITEKEKIFDESLGKEQKLTLQNTLYNKIIK